MAPTRPLVAQQIQACYEIMGIPQADTAEITGHNDVERRQQLWRDKRVFFVTPQVLSNDISRGMWLFLFVRLVASHPLSLIFYQRLFYFAFSLLHFCLL